jgi:CheY-like chemotaxis protein
MCPESTPFKVCLIDDDLIYQFAAKRILELINPAHKVYVFSNGKEALDHFTGPTMPVYDLPDLILLDINMPVMNGWEFLQALEQIRVTCTRDIAVYVVSCSLDDNDSQYAQTFSSVKAYVEKPINKKMMSLIIEAVSSAISTNAQ